MPNRPRFQDESLQEVRDSYTLSLAFPCLKVCDRCHNIHWTLPAISLNTHNLELHHRIRSASPAGASYHLDMDEAVCWRAVESRDSATAGHFFYGVLTTGIFCRPGCSSRTPKRENVRFFLTTSEAEALGYRPCKRCRPDRIESEAAGKVAALCRRMEAGEEKTLDEWAAETGWSPAHLQKTFKASVGLSPSQYSRQVKLGRLKQALRSSSTVTEAMYEAGYTSPSRLHEQSLRGLAMKPSDYMHGGRGVALRYASVVSPVGLALVAWTDRGVCFAEFGQSTSDSLARLSAEFPQAEMTPAHLSDWDAALDLLEGPVDVTGSIFQQMVWSYLRTIPRGETRSYSEVAAALGRPDAARAVARACATNRIAIGIPCHRVIGANGSLSGYRWGSDRKRELLDFEKRQPAAGQTISSAG